MDEEILYNKAIKAAKNVEPLKSAEVVMNKMWLYLKLLKNKGLKGDVLEIGSRKGKTTVFLSIIMGELFPDNIITSVDPYTMDGAKKSLKGEADKIDEIYQTFCHHTKHLMNHRHIKDSSECIPIELDHNLIFTFIDGEHSLLAVWRDFENAYHMSAPGGIIAIDDYQNGAWPGVVKAYKEILNAYGEDQLISVIGKTPKTVFLRVNKIGEENESTN